MNDDTAEATDVEKHVHYDASVEGVVQNRFTILYACNIVLNFSCFKQKNFFNL